MSWLQLDPPSIAARVRAAGMSVPSRGAFVGRGIVGFVLVSVAGFAPWALAGHWFQRTLGEVGLYAVCAGTFIALSGWLSHQLILGPGSLGRFYKLFSVAFAGYAVAWILGWMTCRGPVGSVVGLLAGTTVMGLIFAWAFAAWRRVVKIVAVLFVFNALGYFVGGWVEGQLTSEAGLRTLAKLLWGVCYGAGFGAGLGLAFYYCQTSVRELLATRRD